MYKTQIEKFLLGENLTVSVIKEKDQGTAHYALIKIGLFAMNAYAICILGEEYAIETVGGSKKDAEDLFALSVREGVSPTHLYDVIADFRREDLIENF